MSEMPKRQLFCKKERQEKHWKAKDKTQFLNSNDERRTGVENWSAQNGGTVVGGFLVEARANQLQSTQSHLEKFQRKKFKTDDLTCNNLITKKRRNQVNVVNGDKVFFTEVKKLKSKYQKTFK